MTKKATAPKPAPSKLATSIQKPEPKVPKVAKAANAGKKTPVAAKVASSTSKKLDLCLLLDCTGSMGAWI